MKALRSDRQNRVFRQMNTALDVMLVVYAGFFALLASTYAAEYKDGFIQLLKTLSYILGWTLVLLSALSVIIEISAAFWGHRIYVGRSLWTLVRGAVSFGMLFSTYFAEHFVNGPFRLDV